MKLEQTVWTVAKGWEPTRPGEKKLSPQLVFVFGSKSTLAEESLVSEIRKAYPKAYFLGCSTAGEIYNTSVLDDSLVVTAIEFSDTRVATAAMTLAETRNSYEVGEQLSRLLPREGLRHVFVLSEGLNVNGSELVRGLTQDLPEGVSVTGGLAGDGARFQETFVLWDHHLSGDVVVGIGFYGSALKIGFGSFGGWDTFGPERLITKSHKNILYELDGKSALELYKQYLGEHAKGLPATGLLFPLSVRNHPDEDGVVRTILAINEEEQTMTFAGDVPEGGYARLMKANFDRLIDGAIGAAKTCSESLGSSSPDLAILISCVGRKMVLQQRIEEEIEGVREIFGQDTVLAGFYSYGEISPFSRAARCELHNQTMTITTFSEA